MSREIPTKTVKVRRALSDTTIARSYLEVLGGKTRAQKVYWAHRASECFMFETTIPEDGNVNEMLFREGQRAGYIRDATLAGLSLDDVKAMVDEVGDWNV